MVIDQKLAVRFDRRAKGCGHLLDVYVTAGLTVGRFLYTVDGINPRAHHPALRVVAQNVVTPARLVVDDFGDYVPLDYYPWWRNYYPLDDRQICQLAYLWRYIYHC